jgi:hypothetical protein
MDIGMYVHVYVALGFLIIYKRVRILELWLLFFHIYFTQIHSHNNNNNNVNRVTITAMYM